MFTLHQRAFAPTRRSIQYSSDMRLFTSDIGAAQRLSVTEIAPKSPFLGVKRSSIWYGFRAGAKAISDVM